ncbi:GntR family transcriptional regulator [Streptomyces sp. NBC_01547]|uniref:GntR family transcriptional regulator n=1 Tax=Streptomyces sp. NBC_01547 TaxID=2975873 RepID=UPI00386E271E
MKGFRPHTKTPIERTPASARVYHELRRRILHGELAAGSPLSETEIAGELEVSRTPVREALRELLSDALVLDGRRRQCVVADTSPELEREVLLMRTALESLAAREAATVADESGSDVLHLIMVRTRRALAAKDVNAALDCDDEFHQRLAAMSGLPIVADTVRRLRGFARLIGLKKGWHLADLRRSADEHEQIIAALESGEPDLAERLMVDHLKTGSGEHGRQ